MAETNNTIISIYHSSTASAVPSPSNLALGELALNIFDGKLFFKDLSNNVSLLASKSGALGTVQTVSVVSANGFAGTVATATTTPAITLTTSITGILYGNGTAINSVTVGSTLSFSSGTLDVTSAPSLTTTNWTVSESGGKLYFAYGGVNKASLDSSGNFITVGNVTAYGTP